MANHLFYLMEDLGDGSSAVRWFRTREDAEKYLNGPYADYLWSNDGSVQAVDLNNIHYTEIDNG